MSRDPILKNITTNCEVGQSGLEEIEENVKSITNLSGGIVVGYTKDLYCLASKVLGNHGKVCTWTVECQSNCR